MRFRIAKGWRFEAAHRLDHLSSDHQCSRLHGHSYRVEIVLEWEGDIGARHNGWVVDFGELTVVDDLVARLDHQNLNDVFREWGYGLPTTSECLAFVLWDQIRQTRPAGKYLATVRVSETDRTWAEVTR